MTQRLAIALTAINLVLLCLTAAQDRSASAGTTERPATTSITLRGTGGEERVIRP